MDGTPFIFRDGSTAKGRTIGSPSWPIGIPTDKPIILLVEGSSDIPAAYSIISKDGMGKHASPVAMLGASNSIHRSSLQHFQGKYVLGFPDYDAAGINGMVKRYDENTVAHRFSPRSSKTSWSEVNKQYARLLIEFGKMTSAGFNVLPDLGTNLREYPSGILEELRKNAIVWSNFCAFPPYYRDIRIAAIENLRRYPERFRKALQYFIEKTRKNLHYGRFR